MFQGFSSLSLLAFSSMRLQFLWFRVVICSKNRDLQFLRNKNNKFRHFHVSPATGVTWHKMTDTPQIYRRFSIHSRDNLGLIIPNNKTVKHWRLKVLFIIIIFTLTFIWVFHILCWIFSLSMSMNNWWWWSLDLQILNCAVDSNIWIIISNFFGKYFQKIFEF